MTGGGAGHTLVSGPALEIRNDKRSNPSQSCGLTNGPKMGTNGPNMGATNDDRLSSALFGSVRRRVLGLFFSHPDEGFYPRQVVRLTGAGQGAVQRELKRMSDAGMRKGADSSIAC